MNPFRDELISEAILRIDEDRTKILASLEEIDDLETWDRPNENSNSIGNIILHLCGNIRQYVISSLGNTPDIRKRDEEFSATGGLTKTQLLEKFNATINEARDVIAHATAEDLLRKRKVQGFTHSGIGIVIHVTEHLSYHTGQIIFWVKLLKNKAMKFYEGIDLNIKNDS